MPGRRRTTPKPLTLGFAGSGELDQKAIVAILDDLKDAGKIDLIYIPVSTDDTTSEIEHVHRWAVKNEIDYATVSVEADVKKDKALKAIVEGGTEDYEASEAGAGKDIVELLAGDEQNPVEDGRLIMFFDAEVEEDADVFEVTAEHEVPAFDACNGMEVMRFAEEGETPAADEPDPEPEPEEAPRGRRGKAAKAEEPLPDDEAATGGEGGYTAAEEKEFERMTARETTLVELKRELKKLDPEQFTTETLRGTDKAFCADAIILAKRDAGTPESAADDDEPADEAQGEPTARRGRRAAAQEPQEAATDDEESTDGEAETREAVFARLRGSRESAERIGAGLTASAKKMLELDEEGAEELEKVAGLLAGALMIFADFVVTEVRKPKSAGRPRKDGTEAQPKPPVDPSAPKRGRGRPRKDAE